MRLKVLLVGAAVAVFGLAGSASPASASTCHDSIDEACAVAAFVICKVVNKGQACLY